MRYLRMLTNAIAGGVLVAMYLAVLVLQLNPQLPVVSSTALAWFGALLAFYGPYLSVALFFLILGRDLLATEPLRPAWLSVRLLAWLGAVGAGAAAALTWANLAAFSTMLSDVARERMRAGAFATTATAVALLVIAVLRYSFGRRGSRPVAALLVTCLDVCRWRCRSGCAGRARCRSCRGRLPATSIRTSARPSRRWRSRPGCRFSRSTARRSGSSASAWRPVSCRTSAACSIAGRRSISRRSRRRRPSRSGRRPRRASPRSRTASGRTRATARARTTSIAVDILPDYCFAYALLDQGFVQRSAPTLVVAVRPAGLGHPRRTTGSRPGWPGWPLTYPARADRGFVLSDRFDEAASAPLRLRDASAGDPTTAVDIAREIFDRWQATSRAEIMPALASGPSGADRTEPGAVGPRVHESGCALAQQFAPRLTAVRYEGSRRSATPTCATRSRSCSAIGRACDPQRSVLDRYYAFIDSEIGEATRRLAPGDLLLVVSGFGMEPTPLSKRLLARVCSAVPTSPARTRRRRTDS